MKSHLYAFSRFLQQACMASPAYLSQKEAFSSGFLNISTTMTNHAVDATLGLVEN